MTLDEAIDRLYGADLADFVAERKRLAKELDRDDAQTLSKLRKPTAPAWALNQLARRNRRDVDLLLDAGHRLREAQAGVLRGADRDAFERARKTESDALRRLTRAAEELLGGSASATALNQVNESLRAAAVSEDGRELLARGRFVQPLHAGGFDVVSALAPEAPARRPGAGRGKAQPVDREAQREAREAVRGARDRLRAAERAAREAQAEAARAEAAAEAARREVEEAEARLHRRR